MKIGDKVRMLKTLTEGPGELPAQHFCDAGEILEVRGISESADTPWDFYVAHSYMEPKKMFGVTAEEIEPITI